MNQSGALQTREDINNAVATAMRKGHVSPPTIPYAAPTFVVYRDLKMRVVHDWRIMNSLMKVSAHPLPDPQSSLRDAKDATLFTSLDIHSAFNIMMIHPDDRKLTAVVTEQEFFE